MDLATSATLKATCKLLGTLNVIGLALWLLMAAIVMGSNLLAGIHVAIPGVITFLVFLFLIRCGDCLAEIHIHFCRVEGLDRMAR